MKIFLLRHAVAEPRRPNLAETKRPLTAEGIEELEAVVRGLKRLKLSPGVVLSSPYRRAWDTAVIAARALFPQGPPTEFPPLKPEGSPSRIWAELKPYATVGSLLLVGHEPLLTEFAAFLLNSPHLSINLKKSGLIRIDVPSLKSERPAGQLRWLLTPGQIARMA
jgi:phosphohistidine phosphatase